MKKIALKFLGGLLIILLFILLIFNYYSAFLFEKQQKVNIRFVDVNYETLQREANLIKKNITNQNADNVFVLTYHQITPGEPSDEFAISYEQFKENMFALKKAGYQTITSEELYSYMKNEKELPDKSFLLTFDDASRQAYYNGDPVLKALNYTAVMFVIAGHMVNANSSVYYLNKSELEQMKDTGRWEIGSHTFESHFRLPISNDSKNIAPALTNKLWIPAQNRLETDAEYYKRVDEDLKKAKQILEETFNTSVNMFALPYGDFGERNSNYPNATNVLYNLTAKDYSLVFYQFPLRDSLYRANYNSSEDRQSYLISRIEADSIRTPNSLFQRIEASRIINLPYVDDFSNENKWIRTTGKASFVNNSIILTNGTIDSQAGFLSYLDGSYLLKDYIYSVQIKSNSSSKISLISRFRNPKEYVSCTFENNTASINLQQKTDLKWINSSAFSDVIGKNTTLSMSVKGNNVSCFINNEEKLTSEVIGIPENGGIAIKAENFLTNDKTFSFGEVSITGR